MRHSNGWRRTRATLQFDGTLRGKNYCIDGIKKNISIPEVASSELGLGEAS
jgi:hypothetical protein